MTEQTRYRARRALPQATEPPTRRNVSWLGWLALALAVGLAGGAGATRAAWTAGDDTEPLNAQTTVVGFSVQRDGLAAAVADGPGSTVGFTLTSADAQAVAASGGLAVGFTVTTMTSGRDGMNYQLSVAAAEPGSFLDGATIEVFPQGPAGCLNDATPGAVDLDDATGAVIGTAPAQAPRPSGSTATQAWCLTVVKPAVWYNSQAQAVGTNSVGGTVTSNTAEWSVQVGPDPAAQPPLDVTFTHTVTKFAGVGK